MGNKVYKGQGVVVEGSLSGETITITKMAYDNRTLLEYIGEAKIGSNEDKNKWFIQKLTYDNRLSNDNIMTATNRTNVGSTNVSIDASNSNKPIITLNNGDFSEINDGDLINLKTPSQTISGFPVRKISDTQILINFIVDCGQPPSTPILSESNVDISLDDFIVTLVHSDTKCYTKRRWSNRDRYIYE